MSAKSNNAVHSKNHVAISLINRLLQRKSVIVTKSVKGVYQKPTYMNADPTPKICLANKANPD
ncbi:hypothetical protein EMIT0P294_100204 [Pseudomonas sp. IT-P294]